MLGKHLTFISFLACFQNQDQREDGKNCLHGGSRGYDLRYFKHVHSGSVLLKYFQQVDEDQNENDLGLQIDEHTQREHFHLYSPDGDQGFPETIDLLATITLTTLNQELDSTQSYLPLARLGFSLKAKIREDGSHSNFKRPRGTPINLTWHLGYILNPFGHRANVPSGIDQYKLWVNVSSVFLFFFSPAKESYAYFHLRVKCVRVFFFN